MNVYIKEHLNILGITQKELAERIGVTQQSISATISRPSFPTLERIAAALDVEQLVGNGLLTRLIVSECEFTQEFVGIVRRYLHCHDASSMFAS